MPGLGAFPLGFGPYGGATPPEPVEPVTTAISCRLIDGVARDYVTDANGNPVPQDGTANRVYLLLSYAYTRPEIISAQSIAQAQADIRAALSALTTGPSPAIADLDVQITDSGGSETFGLVTYRNLATQEIESIELL
jgi:hypothetical protein